ncbi:methyltransferase domain-containing protein [Mycena galopus ATCC 62051]|nr:methyltransferase domain-containing protein [Mycena galopus ATCC 62051]
MQSAGIFQRVNRQALTQHWRWLAVSATVLLACTVYLLGHGDTHEPPPIQYQELLTTTNISNCAVPIQLGGTSRLAKTLAGNERRYQRMIVAREALIAKTGGMDISAFGPPHRLRDALWDFYVPEFSCPHPMYRVGILADGGKWVCGVERVLYDRPNCLIYSLNQQGQSYSSFEVNMLERSSGCQVHVFDGAATTDAPSKWPWGETEMDTALIKPRVHFNQFALSDPTASKYRSLKSTMRAFNHEWIDILKVELAGSEFATLLSMIAEYGDEPLPFGQLIITVHTGLTDDMKTVGQFNDWWTRLECAGLRPYYFEVSMMDVNNRRNEPSVVYWSFMNIRGTHALVDDALPEYP